MEIESTSLSSPNLKIQPSKSRRWVSPSQWLAFFLHPLHIDHINLSLCQQYNICYSSARARYKKWKEAGKPTQGDPSNLPGCGNDRHRGRRVLSDESEESVSTMVRETFAAEHRQLTNDILRPFLHQAFIPPSHITRSTPPAPTFTDSFIHRFKTDHNLSSSFLPVRHRGKPPSLREEKAQDRKDKSFIDNVNYAIVHYGADLVLNMDETPAQLAPARARTIHIKGDTKDNYVEAGGDPKAMTTTVVTVSASGKKLPLLFITKGTTDRSTEKFLGLVDYPHHVRFSESGWMNTELMIWYLENIIRPYANQRPCCLVLDSFAAHTEDDDVDEKAVEMDMWMIFVPEGETWRLQPLDVKINAFLKQKRNKAWQEERMRDPLGELGVGYGAKFMTKAYDELEPSVIKKSFIEACKLNDNELN